VVRAAGPRVALRTIGVVSRGGLLAVLLWVREPVALGICGVGVAPVAASFLALWVVPGVSVVGASVPGLNVAGFPTLVVNEPMGRWWSVS